MVITKDGIPASGMDGSSSRIANHCPSLQISSENAKGAVQSM